MKTARENREPLDGLVVEKLHLKNQYLKAFREF